MTITISQQLHGKHDYGGKSRERDGTSSCIRLSVRIIKFYACYEIKTVVSILPHAPPAICMRNNDL